MVREPRWSTSIEICADEPLSFTAANAASWRLLRCVDERVVESEACLQPRPHSDAFWRSSWLISPLNFFLMSLHACEFAWPLLHELCSVSRSPRMSGLACTSRA